MAQQNRIDVTIIPATDLDPQAYGDALYFTDVNYISFVSSPGGQGEGTYGIPAMLGVDNTSRQAKAEGYPLTVLYVNPANITAMKATRKA